MGAPLRIDSRQQEGRHNAKNRWFAAHGVETVRVKLDAGDYAYAPSNILIDTKRDVDELAMNVGRDHARFVREMDRAAAAGCRLVVLVEQHPEFSDREGLRGWLGYSCRRCRRCDPNAGDACAVRRCTPMHGARLAKILDRLEERHGVRFEFCSRRDAARVICETLGIGYD